VFYAQIQGPKALPGFKEFQANPDQFIDKELGFQGKILLINNGFFLMEQISEGERINLNVTGALVKAKPGDNISGVAIYQADKSLILNRYIISNSRPAKIAISLIALLVVTLLFFRDFTFNFKKLMFIERK
jgi:hypothetical protein